MGNKNLSIDQIKSNYAAVLGRIKHASIASGRDPGDIKLVVVSKEKSIKTIQNAATAGIKIFGENYAEEAIQKINAIKDYPDLHWHMIGHIQSRKAQTVVEYFDYIHSLDSLKLARRLDRFALEYNKQMACLIEFNTGGEDTKYGFQAWNEESWENLLPSIEQIMELSFIQIKGLMTVPPYFTDPEKSRPYFQLLSKLQNYLQSELPNVNWSELSMGMSEDFEIAIEEGATWIRVGQAILGKRK